MKNILMAALAAALVCGVSLAQSSTPTSPGTPQTQAPTTTPAETSPRAPAPSSSAASQSQPANKPRIAPGSVIPVQLTKTVDAKKAKTGDEVVGKVTQDMTTQSGEVLVPKDTKVIGHVTEAQARSKEQKESQLAIAFDRTETKDGNSMQMPMSIQAIIGQQNNNANPGAGGGEPASSGMPSGGNSAPSSASQGRTGGMNGSSTPQGGGSPAATSSADNAQTQTGNTARPPINAQTQGVIGISNMSLSPANGTQGSVVTSEKSNVKLESGTMLLLKVQ